MRLALHSTSQSALAADTLTLALLRWAETCVDCHNSSHWERWKVIDVWGTEPEMLSSYIVFLGWLRYLSRLRPFDSQRVCYVFTWEMTPGWVRPDDHTCVMVFENGVAYRPSSFVNLKVGSFAEYAGLSLLSFFPLVSSLLFRYVRERVCVCRGRGRRECVCE